MIEEISISNLGVIGEAVLPLGAGFTAITGETGAGKTMVVSALGLLLGGRSDASAIRSGAAQAVVEGRWRISGDGAVAERVRDAGGDLDDGELILTRSVSQEGRSRAVVGGRSAPVGVLAELGEQLVVVHGQSDQIRLRSAVAQRDTLDRFAGEPFARLLADYQDVYRRWQATQGELDVLIAERQQREREAEELRAAIDEIEQAQPQRGEDSELSDRANRLSNLEDLRLAASMALEIMSGESLAEASNAHDSLETARRHLERVSTHDATLEPVVEAIAASSFAVAEATGLLSSYLSGLDSDGGRELEEIQARRAELAALVRKYGANLDEVVDYLDSGSERLVELDNDSDRITTLSEQVEADKTRLLSLADSLTDERKKNAEVLGARVTDELGALAMPNATVKITVVDRPEYSPTGKDAVSFLMQPHSGAELRPLAKGASGGELSRVMLAIEVVIAGSDPVPTFIFDEVDAGVGGASAIEIGKRLAQLSQTAQVIAVTHLAQVAAFATNHLRVTKDNDGAVTASSVRQLNGEERVSEMARLLSGLPDSQSGLDHARELMSTARALVS